MYGTHIKAHDISSRRWPLDLDVDEFNMIATLTAFKQVAVAQYRFAFHGCLLPFIVMQRAGAGFWLDSNDLDSNDHLPTTYFVFWCLLTLQYVYQLKQHLLCGRTCRSCSLRNEGNPGGTTSSKKQPTVLIPKNKSCCTSGRRKPRNVFSPWYDATWVTNPPAQTLKTPDLLVAFTPGLAFTRQAFLLGLASQVRTSTRELPPSCHTYGALVTKDIEGAGAGDRIR